MRTITARIAGVMAAALFTLPLNGCLDQRIYEKIAFIVNVGIDTSDDGKLLVTYTYPVAGGSETSGGQSGGGGEASGSIPIDIIDTRADLLREAREKSNEMSPRKLEGGKIQNLLVGKSIAQIGLQDFLDIFERDPKNPVLAWVIVVDGSAGDLIKKGHNYKNKPPLGIYINQLVDDNSRTGYCPAETIIDFNVESSIPGIDPITPMVAMDDDGVRVTGSALFHRGKLTGRLDTQESAHLMMMKGRRRESMIYFIPPRELAGLKKKVALSLQGIKNKFELRINDGIPEMTYNIKLETGLDEYRFYSMLDADKESRLAKAAQEQITRRMREVFDKLKEASCDTLGIGDKVRAYENDYWNSIGGKDGWEQIYPKVKAAFNVEVKINNYGRLK